MPDIRIELVSQRGRKVDDKVDLAEFKGTHYVHPLDVQKGQGYVLADLAPGRYTGRISVNGFKGSIGSFQAKAKQNKVLKWPMVHRCTLLPGFSDLDDEQKRLFRSYAGNRDAAALWRRLGDNQACTFFQVTYALARTPMGGAVLSDYIQKVRVVGGAATVAKAPDGRMRKAAGWRIHVVIKPKFRQTMAQDLARGGFKKDRGKPVPTHARFGFVHSYRQKGGNPRLQIVLNRDASGADMDLDKSKWNHKSSPHEIYGNLRKKFPAVHAVYRVR